MSLLNFSRNCIGKRQLDLFGLLFQNRSHKQVILKNTFWLSVAEGLTVLFNVFLAVYAIRVFGPTEYGKFAFALSFVFLFSTLFDFGLSTAVTREFAGLPEEERHFPDILTLKTLLSVGVVLLIVGLSYFISDDRLIHKIIMVLCVYGLSLEGVYLFYAFFRARQQMEIEAAFRVLQVCLLCASVVAVICFKPSILNLSLAYMASTVCTLLAVVIFFLKCDYSVVLCPAFNTSVWKKFFSIGLYLALAKGAGDITTYTDSVLLGYFGMVKETGLYNAMLKINKLVLLPMGLITAALFPTLISILRESNERFNRYYKAWMKGTIFLSVLLLFVVLAEADRIVLAVFSADFLPASTALKLLIMMAVLVSIHNVYYHILLISGQQKRIFYTFLSAAIINVILNLFLIPRFGINGAAIASVITHSVILCQYLFLCSKYTIIKPIESGFILVFLAAIISGLLMWWGASAMANVNLFVSLLVATLIYALLFAGLTRMSRGLVSDVLH